MSPIVFTLAGVYRNIATNGKLGLPPPMIGFIPLPTMKLYISGVTQDGVSQTPLSGCTVNLMRTLDNVCLETIISDESGNYSFSSIGLGLSYYVTAYTAAGDLAGITVNTLTGA